MMHGMKCKETKEYWIIMISMEGFESVMLMYGTQSEMWSYMKNSFSYIVNYRYRTASNEEVTMAKRLGIKAYIC